MITLAKILLALASEVMKMLAQKQLIDAGVAKAYLQGAKDANDAIDRAMRIRRNTSGVPDDDDRFNRRNSDE